MYIIRDKRRRYWPVCYSVSSATWSSRRGRRGRVTGEKGRAELLISLNHSDGIFRPECGLECGLCRYRGDTFDNLIEHLGSRHEINLRKQVRKMEREAKKNSVETKCRICKKLVARLEFLVRMTWGGEW